MDRPCNLTILDTMMSVVISMWCWRTILLTDLRFWIDLETDRLVRRCDALIISWIRSWRLKWSGIKNDLVIRQVSNLRFWSFWMRKILEMNTISCACLISRYSESIWLFLSNSCRWISMSLSKRTISKVFHYHLSADLPFKSCKHWNSRRIITSCTVT